MINVNVGVYIYIYHTWMVRERLFRVPGCFFCDESFLSREAANNLSHGRIKSARFRTDLLVGSKHSFERTNPTGASAVKKASLFSRSISSLQNDDMKVTLCFALPVLTFQQKHQESCIFWTHRRFAAVFVFFEHIYECLMILLEEIRLTILKPVEKQEIIHIN